MSIALEMPLMVVKEENMKKLVLLPIPYNTKYIVGGYNIELDSLLKGSVFRYNKRKLLYF